MNNTITRTILRIFLAGALVATLAAGCSITNTKKQDTGQNTQTSNITYQGQQGKTALDLLKSKYPGQVQTQTFSSGEFVKSINGITPDKEHYWSFFVNGKESTVGASQYVTKDGDSIEWKLQQINNNL